MKQQETVNSVSYQADGFVFLPYQGIAVNMSYRVWWRSPDRFREEMKTEVKEAGLTFMGGLVYNGITVWNYLTTDGTTQVRIGTPSLEEVTLLNRRFIPNTIFGDVVRDAHELVEGIKSRSTSDVLLTEGPIIAGRPTLTTTVVTDLLAMDLPIREADPVKSVETKPQTTVLWLDEETFVQLKRERYNADGQLLASMEVASIRYNESLPDDLFSYTPAANATVTYNNNALAILHTARSGL